MKKFELGYFDVDYSDNQGIYAICKKLALGKKDYATLSKGNKKLLLAELHQSTIFDETPVYQGDTSPFLDALYSNGFITYMEGLAGFKKLSWVRRVYVPGDIPMGEQLNTKTRIVTGAYEGLLFGLESYNPELKKDLPEDKRLLSFFAHLAYWVKTYAKIEADIICGERSGVLVLSEMNKDKRKSYGERKRRKILRLTKNLPQNISYDHILQHLHDKGETDVDIIDIQCAVGGVISHIETVNNEDMPSNMTRYSGKFLTYELIDHIHALKHVRDELMYALAHNIGGERKIAFTAELARTVDLFYFGSLPLTDNIYEDSGNLIRYKSLISQLKRLQSFTNSEASLVIKDRIKILEAQIDDLRATLLLRIPDVDTALFSLGMLQYPFKLLDSCGDTDFSKIYSVKVKKNNKIDIAALNLVLKRLSVAYNCSVNYSYINNSQFKKAKKDISFMKKLIEERGYFDPESINVLPSVEEVHKLNKDLVPTQVKDMDGTPLFVKLFGEYKPMLTWV